MQKIYMFIDLKTFYASVECVERGLDPFNTNLVVADQNRGKGTICLAVSPKMKMLGVKNRCRIYEIPPTIKYIIAMPRMKKYIEYSANIYEIYLKYFSKEDIHVYSIDEAFMDASKYLKLYKSTPIELAKKIYKEFGINAEYLIDHSFGKESCTIADIKSYKPKCNSISNSQVLFEDYSFIKARLVLKEMVELGSLRLVENNLMTDTIGLYIGYSKDVIRATGGTKKLTNYTNIYSELLKSFLDVYDKTTNKNFSIRRIGINLANVTERENIQLNLFIDQEKVNKERKLELAMCNIKNKMGKNTIIRGMNLEEGATAMARNKLIGGHRSGE